MSSRFVIDERTTQINFRYRCIVNFCATTTSGGEHIFKEKTVLRVDELYDDSVLLTYFSFDDKKRIELRISNDFPHLDKLKNFIS
jgi:hypothetical protein